MLYRVTFLCKESKLGASLAALRGKITGKVEFDYITGHPDDAEEADETPLKPTKSRTWRSKGQPKPVGETLPDKVAASFNRKLPLSITPAVVRKATTMANGNENSYTYVLKELKTLGILTPNDDGSYAFNPEAYQKRMEKTNEEA